MATPVIAKKVRKEVEEFDVVQRFTKEMIDEARTRFEKRKVGISSVSTSRQNIITNVKKEKPLHPPKIQIKRKENQDEPQEPKATRKKKKERKNRHNECLRL